MARASLIFSRKLSVTSMFMSRTNVYESLPEVETVGSLRGMASSVELTEAGPLRFGTGIKELLLRFSPLTLRVFSYAIWSTLGGSELQAERLFISTTELVRLPSRRESTSLGASCS